MLLGHLRPVRVALLWLSILVTLAGCGGTSCLDAGTGAAGPAVVLERGHLERHSWQLVAWEQGGHLGLGLDGDSQEHQYSGGVGFCAGPAAGFWLLASGQQGLGLLLRSSPCAGLIGPYFRQHRDEDALSTPAGSKRIHASSRLAARAKGWSRIRTRRPFARRPPSPLANRHHTAAAAAAARPAPRQEKESSLKWRQPGGPVSAHYRTERSALKPEADAASAPPHVLDRSSHHLPGASRHVTAMVFRAGRAVPPVYRDRRSSAACRAQIRMTGGIPRWPSLRPPVLVR